MFCLLGETDLWEDLHRVEQAGGEIVVVRGGNARLCQRAFEYVE